MTDDLLGTDYELLNPIPRPSSGPFTVRLRPESQRVVLVDNGKPNSMAILRKTQAELRARGITVDEDIRSKPFAGVPLNEEFLAWLSKEDGLVLCGIND